MIGQTLGPYRIVAKLGKGGMGEVYKALDTRLDRTVAVKILPSTDPDQRQRFAREARAIAALSHPHICVVHDVGQLPSSSDPTRPIDFLVIEYLEGESLAERLQAGPLSPHVMVALGVQIADALEAAHESGIIHRDLKPQNVFVTRRGQAKVLDFGIAKLVGPTGVVDESAGPTMAAAERGLTDPGTAVGTLAYMSPEQARGEDVDARTDLFSCGAVLYEMATGRPAFSGRTSAVTVDALLNRSPAAVREVNPAVPPELERVIARALEKDRTRRYQRAADLRADLEDVQRSLAPRGSPGSAGRRHAIPRRARLVMAAAVVPLVALGVLAFQWLTTAGRVGSPIDSIAVLPFVNASGTPDADYLGDGLSETITNSLTRVPGLRVVPRTLAARYKSTTADPREAGVTLNARAIVTGRVTHRGDRLVVQAELIDSVTVAQLWGEQYDRPFSDVLAVQAEIARAVADNLRLHLTREEELRLAAGTPANAVAYELYLRGRHETNKRTREGYAAATTLFEQAIAQDPTYARAHAGLADVFLWQGYWGYLRARDAYPRAMAAAQQAVALDERSADAHASLGWLNLYYLWNWPESTRHYERALTLDPTSAFVRAWHGESLSTRGRHDEAIAEVRRALALDPLSPQTMTSLAFVLSNAGQYDEAIEVQRAAVASGIRSSLAQLDLARMYRLSGRYEEAIELSRQMVATDDPLGPAFLAASYARAGRRAEALAIVRKMEVTFRRSREGGFLLALVYAALRDRDRALGWLEEAYVERDTFLPWLKVDPEFVELRADPRFDRLIRRIGIPDR